MQKDVKQVFYFNAAANSVGGFVEDPFGYIPTPCSAALSSSGGSVTTELIRRDSLEHEDVISWDKVHTHVSGRHIQKNGPWIERSVSIVEGFSLLGKRIAAKRLVAHIHIEHPDDGGPRKISFAGSSIEGLSVDGQQVDLIWNSTLLPLRDKEVNYYNHDEPIKTELEWPMLGSAAQRQTSTLINGTSPEWLRNRLGWIINPKDRGGSEAYTICSLVDKVGVPAPNQSCGHCIEIPDIGRIFLGESTIYPQAIGLTMIRAELGCERTGQVAAATVSINGNTVPPS